MVVHGQIVLNQFRHYPIKAVAKSAFVAALRQKMELRRHCKLYSAPKVRKALACSGVLPHSQCRAAWRAGCLARAGAARALSNTSLWFGASGVDACMCAESMRAAQHAGLAGWVCMGRACA